jgi:hypothetical protein
MAAGVATMNLASAGESAEVWLSSHALRGRFVSGCDYAICDLGIVDVLGGASLATVQARLVAAWQHLAGLGLAVWQDTLLPVSTSTDGWVTTTNQTTDSHNPVRSALNQWVRAGAPLDNALVPVTPGTSGALTAGTGGHPLTGTFDCATLVETSTHAYGGGTDSGIWKVAPGMALTSDGNIPGPAGCDVAAPGVPVAKFT